MLGCPLPAYLWQNARSKGALCNRAQPVGHIHCQYDLHAVSLHGEGGDRHRDDQLSQLRGLDLPVVDRIVEDSLAEAVLGLLLQVGQIGDFALRATACRSQFKQRFSPCGRAAVVALAELPELLRTIGGLCATRMVVHTHDDDPSSLSYFDNSKH